MVLISCPELHHRGFQVIYLSIFDFDLDIHCIVNPVHQSNTVFVRLGMWVGSVSSMRDLREETLTSYFRHKLNRLCNVLDELFRGVVGVQVCRYVYIFPFDIMDVYLCNVEVVLGK